MTDLSTAFWLLVYFPIYLPAYNLHVPTFYHTCPFLVRVLTGSAAERRNPGWRHLRNSDVVSMPDKWEFPWVSNDSLKANFEMCKNSFLQQTNAEENFAKLTPVGNFCSLQHFLVSNFRTPCIYIYLLAHF